MLVTYAEWFSEQSSLLPECYRCHLLPEAKCAGKKMKFSFNGVIAVSVTQTTSYSLCSLQHMFHDVSLITSLTHYIFCTTQPFSMVNINSLNKSKNTISIIKSTTSSARQVWGHSKPNKDGDTILPYTHLKCGPQGWCCRQRNNLNNYHSSQQLVKYRSLTTTQSGLPSFFSFHLYPRAQTNPAMWDNLSSSSLCLDKRHNLLSNPSNLTWWQCSKPS